MDAACMGDTTLTKQCPDCGVTYHAHHPLCNRCPPCQRLFRNAETCRRDKARRQRQKAAEQAAAVLGLAAFGVVRDNGHRCRACRRVLFLDQGMAPHLCHECRRVNAIAEVVVQFVLRVLELAVTGVPWCCICGNSLPYGRTTTCGDKCLQERGRQRGRDKYERVHGVKLRPLSHPRTCRYCTAAIHAANENGRGRSVCDACGLHRGDFKSRARLHNVEYTVVDKKAVFVRDGWKCQLCGRNVLRRSKRGTRTKRLHPRTASLDHIVPMSKGGPHVERNVQCACLACNVRKHARLKGQLRMF